MSNELTYAEKCKNILNFFKAHFEEFKVIAWADGESAEYCFEGTTIIILKDKSWCLFDGDDRVADIARNGETALDEGCDDEIEAFDKLYDEFCSDKLSYEKAHKAV